MRRDADLFGVEALNEGAQHRVGAFTGGQVIQLFREGVLDVLDPAGGAAGDHRENGFTSGQSFLEAVQELGAFLHNGKVGCKVGVKDIVKTEVVERRGHLAGDAGTDFHAELFTQRGADGRSDLDNNAFIRVCKRAPYLVDSVRLNDGADGANGGALTAHGAIDA